MIPINQTQFHGQGVGGNCVQASVASILELPLDRVPHFLEIAQEPAYWEVEFDDWLEARGIASVRFNYHHAFDGFYLAAGRSPRVGSHMCVFHNGNLAHDPHPSRSGLVDVSTTRIFVPLDVARWVGPVKW